MEILVIQVGVNSRGQPQRDQRRIRGDVLRVGRTLECELQLPDPQVARDHALISFSAQGAVMTASGGALKINGKSATQAVLSVGDRIDIGPYRLEVEAAPAGLLLALAVTHESALPPTCGERIRSAESGRPRVSRRRLSYIALLGLLLLCLLVPVAPDLLDQARQASPAALAVASAATVDTPVSVPTAAASASAITAHPHIDTASLEEAVLRGAAGNLIQAWNPGPLAQGHQIFASDCGACHQTPFVQVRDEACKTCHKDTLDHVPISQLTGPAGHAFAETRCAECHRDHKGPHLAVRSQEQCADCHRDVKQVAAQATSANVVDFYSGHPAFRISLSDAATPDQVRRVRQATPMPADMVERSRLKFNHQVHLDPAGVRDPDGKRDPAGMRDAQGQRTVLECQSCHVPADGGRLMAPVKMEQHCQRCHSLAFEPSVTTRQAVHGDDAHIATMLREFYARLVLGDVPEGVHPPDDLPRVRPGAVLTAEDRSRALAIADHKAKQVLHELFETRQVCSTCHEVSRVVGEDRWKVASVKISSSWMPQAQFSHAAHGSEPCARCHDVARSTDSKDVAMPQIETCRECHVGAQAVAGKVTSDCATCHGYHGAVKGAVAGLVAGAASAHSTARVAHANQSFKDSP
jgi:hypothetical protein